VTNDLTRRVYEHRPGQGGGFTSRYRVNQLVYYEACGDVRAAIAREKQVKGGSRQKKVDLIEAMNPGWRDLSEGM
jgi:putative endonuclease